MDVVTKTEKYDDGYPMGPQWRQQTRQHRTLVKRSSECLEYGSMSASRDDTTVADKMVINASAMIAEPNTIQSTNHHQSTNDTAADMTAHT